MKTTERIYLGRLVGKLIRNGVPVFYAFIDGKKIERTSPCSVNNALQIAYFAGKKVGS